MDSFSLPQGKDSVRYKHEHAEGLAHKLQESEARLTELHMEKRFLEGAQEALVEGTDWSYEEELGLLREEARVVADQCRKDETKKMVNVIEVRTWFDRPSMQKLMASCTAQLQEADLGAGRGLPQSAYS